MNQLALQSQVEYMIKIISGPDAGATFKIVSPVIRIGRSSENDIPLTKDPRCSRHHAEISFSKNGILIKSLSDKNLISVDGKAGEALMLKHNSKIKLGSTKLLFQISMLIDSPSEGLALVDKGVSHGLGPSHPKHEPALNNSVPSKKNFRVVLIGALGLILLFALTETAKKKQENDEIRLDEQIEAEIAAINKIREAEAQEQSRQGRTSPEFEEAQALYIKGFRDFRKGQFERAISSFEACISIFPQHELCQTYRKLSEKKFQELVQYHMVLGKKYMDKGQYLACKSSFRNVMIMVKNPQNQTYKEANANYMLCRSRLEGRY